MKKILLSLLCFSCYSYAQKIKITLPASKGTIVKHSYYNLAYEEAHEQACWVAYVLKSTYLTKNVKRSNRFKADRAVKTGSASLDDYKASGYDRGHLLPAGSMTFDKIAMEESFLMSNMSPQVPGFNRGVWKRLETAVRGWTLESDSLYVVTGPVLKDVQKHIGVNQVSVPKAYYKVLLRFHKGKTDAIGFLLPNQKSSAPLQSFAKNIDFIERETGIDFNAGLNDVLENNLESSCATQVWF